MVGVGIHATPHHASWVTMTSNPPAPSSYASATMAAARVTIDTTRFMRQLLPRSSNTVHICVVRYHDIATSDQAKLEDTVIHPAFRMAKACKKKIPRRPR